MNRIDSRRWSNALPAVFWLEAAGLLLVHSRSAGHRLDRGWLAYELAHTFDHIQNTELISTTGLRSNRTRTLTAGP